MRARTFYNVPHCALVFRLIHLRLPTWGEVCKVRLLLYLPQTAFTNINYAVYLQNCFLHGIKHDWPSFSYIQCQFSIDQQLLHVFERSICRDKARRCHLRRRSQHLFYCPKMCTVQRLYGSFEFILFSEENWTLAKKYAQYPVAFQVLSN